MMWHGLWCLMPLCNQKPLNFDKECSPKEGISVGAGLSHWCTVVRVQKAHLHGLACGARLRAIFLTMESNNRGEGAG
jgi:hypothetical protein